MITKNGCIGIPGQYIFTLRSLLDTSKTAELWGKVQKGAEMSSFWGFLKGFAEGPFDFHTEYYALTVEDVEQIRVMLKVATANPNNNAKTQLELIELDKYFGVQRIPAH